MSACCLQHVGKVGRSTANKERRTRAARFIPDSKRTLGVGIDNIIGSSPEELRRFIRAEIEKYGKLVNAAGIKQQ